MKFVNNIKDQTLFFQMVMYDEGVISSIFYENQKTLHKCSNDNYSFDINIKVKFQSYDSIWVYLSLRKYKY